MNLSVEEDRSMARLPFFAAAKSLISFELVLSLEGLLCTFKDSVALAKSFSLMSNPNGTSLFTCS